MSQRYALFTQNMTGGGAERVMMNLANTMTQMGVAVDLVLCHADGPYLTHLEPGVRVVDLKQPKIMAAYPRFLEYVQRERPAAILSALQQPNLMAAWAKKKTGTRAILSIHNTLSQDAAHAQSLRMRLMPFFVRRYFGLADGIVGCSRGVTEDYKAFSGQSGPHIVTIYNPVVHEEIIARSHEAPAHDWFRGDVPVVLALGRLTTQKNFGLFLEAMRKVADRRPVRGLIVGEGELREELEKHRDALNLRGIVELPGFTANPFAAMRSAAVVAQSSLWEGLPTVLIEGLACGANMVATDCPSGPMEILDNGKYGRLVPMNDAEALANAISEALDDPKRNQRDETWHPYEVRRVTRQYMALLAPEDPQWRG